MNEQSKFEPCEECGAPLDAQQRYCVECGARRGNGANPSSRYFATMSKRAHRPPPRPPAASSGGSGSRAAAVGFFALLPIAVAIGVVVGRSGNDSGENQALLEALHRQSVAAAETSSSAGTTTPAKTKAGKGKAAKASAKGGGKVVAHTSNGTVHEIGGYKAPKKTVEEDTRLVEENPAQTGSNYIKAQQGLPDVIVVGGEGGSAPASSKGAGEP
jgi:hypothetical protein